eukprot:TRINITY_DN2380_c0_g1_i1.p1 TRINITY_DN2380_c0_g1~~TRINITY_DN2380_c0_g1_i1.p1  ORF type:complete len:420 (-),score=100.51 TRINITY_DN2380_c0_g1_i1:101-1360(-)
MQANFRVAVSKTRLANVILCQISCRYKADIAGRQTQVLGWGKNAKSLQVPAASHTPVAFPQLDDKQICQVAAGYAHSLFLSSSGLVYSAGLNDCGQLGNGTAGKEPVAFASVKGLAGKKIRQVAAGGWNSFAVAEDGSVYSWGWSGSARSGSTAIGFTTSSDVTVATNIPGLKNVQQVVAGERHALALSADGKVFSWGEPSQCRLGHGSTLGLGNAGTLPDLVETLAKHKIVQVAAGKEFSAAISDQGDVYTWGNGSNKQLGNGDDRAYDAVGFMPRRVEKLFGKGDQPVIATEIACGDEFVAVADTRGHLYMWGKGIHFLPVRKAEFDDLGVLSVVAGRSAALVLTKDGSIHRVRNTMTSNHSPLAEEKPKKLFGFIPQSLPRIGVIETLSQKSADRVLSLALGHDHGLAVIASTSKE